MGAAADSRDGHRGDGQERRKDHRLPVSANNVGNLQLIAGARGWSEKAHTRSAASTFDCLILMKGPFRHCRMMAGTIEHISCASSRTLLLDAELRRKS